MMKWLLMTVLGGVILGSTAHAQSLREMELRKLLEQVAQESNVGTPRAINANLLDQGYAVEGLSLVNYISVQPRHAAMMRDNPKTVHQQLKNSVCSNPGFLHLLENGADLRYEFTEYQTHHPVISERFQASDCGI